MVITLSLLALFVGILAGPAAASSPPAGSGQPRQAGPHPMPWHQPGNAPTNGSAPAGAHLAYYGGRVMTNALVQDVYWGSGTYESGAGQGQLMPGFFNAVGSSEYFDWLTEYNTTINAVGGQQGTHQVIGHASFLGEKTIAPAAANNGPTIDDTNIQAELQAELTSGALPAPVTDGHNNVDTLYGLYFPQGKTLTLGTSVGGQPGGFCAYHGTILWNGLSVPYMVLPDFADPTAGYSTGCGADSNLFHDFTSVTSHELVESVTDTEVGFASTFGPPLAWYDQVNNAEIGDLCNQQQGSIAGYTVQTEFSNQANNCIVGKTATNNFSVSASPSSVVVPQGGSGSSTISTSLVSGAPQTISLSASNLPTGASASFTPASVLTGLSSTLTILGGTAATGSYIVNVTATNGSITHTTPVAVTVTSSTGGNDFSISANPSSVSIAPNSSKNVTINTAVVSGSAQTISLTASGLPTGASASFNPTSVNAGASSTVTISTGSAASGSYTVTVQGSATSGTHTTTISLTITRIPTALYAAPLHTQGFHPTARLTRADTGAPLSGQVLGFSTSLGTCSAVTNWNGVAQCSNKTAFGNYTASYGGNATYAPSSASGVG
jgi:hypothetical protein